MYTTQKKCKMVRERYRGVREDIAYAQEYIKEPATHMHICGNNEGLSLKYSLTCIYLKLANVLRVRAPNNCPAKSFTNTIKYTSTIMRNPSYIYSGKGSSFAWFIPTSPLYDFYTCIAI